MIPYAHSGLVSGYNVVAIHASPEGVSLQELDLRWDVEQFCTAASQQFICNWSAAADFVAYLHLSLDARRVKGAVELAAEFVEDLLVRLRSWGASVTSVDLLDLDDDSDDWLLLDATLPDLGEDLWTVWAFLTDGRRLRATDVTMLLDRYGADRYDLEAYVLCPFQDVFSTWSHPSRTTSDQLLARVIDKEHESEVGLFALGAVPWGLVVYREIVALVVPNTDGSSSRVPAMLESLPPGVVRYAFAEQPVERGFASWHPGSDHAAYLRDLMKSLESAGPSNFDAIRDGVDGALADGARFHLVSGRPQMTTGHVQRKQRSVGFGRSIIQQSC